MALAMAFMWFVVFFRTVIVLMPLDYIYIHINTIYRHEKYMPPKFMFNVKIETTKFSPIQTHLLE